MTDRHPAAATAPLDLLESLVRLETSIWNATDRVLAEEGSPRLGTLLALRVVAAHAGGARVQDLRVALGITIGAASKLVDRLQADGLVERTPHPTDRRSSMVSLTSAGEAAVTGGVAVAEPGTRRAVAVHTAELRAVLDALLAIVPEESGR